MSRRFAHPIEHLRDVLPVLSVYNMINGTDVDLKTISQLDRSHPSSFEAANLSHRRLIETSVFLLGPATYATLHRSIYHVVSVGSKKQMIWVDTGSVVTRVKYEESLGDWTIAEDPRQAVRSNGLSELISAEIDGTVSARDLSADPFPASIPSFRDLLPEAI